jgi:hypothetical protein
VEPPLVTSGDEILTIVQALPSGATHYSAHDVIDYLEARVRV